MSLRLLHINSAVTSRICGILLLLAVSLSTMGQYTSASSFSAARGLPNLPGYEQRRLHFGFLMGFAMLDYHIYNSGLRTEHNDGVARYAEVTKLDPGLVLGIVTDLKVCNNLNFRVLPGISFGQRNLLYVDEYGNPIDDQPLKIKSTFVECPFLLKYGAKRIHNFRPFMVGGVTPRFDLAKDKQDHLNMRSMDVYGDVGGGLDFYLTYFRLSVELRGAFGLTNIYSKEQSDDYEDLPYNQAISKLKSRWWGLVVYFE